MNGKKADDQKLKAERKQQLRDDEERAAPGEAWLERRDAVCTDTVYCAKHLSLIHISEPTRPY